MLYMEKQPIWTVFCAKIPQPAIVSASAGVPPAALVAAAQAAGSTGGRLWRQSLHLSALLSSVSWRDDKCNHQENNIILYLPRLYQVPYLPCAVQQDSGIFRSGMEFLIWESKFIFLKKTCEMTAVTLVTICTYVAKHIEFADLLTIFCSVLVTLRWSFDVRFFALELLHAKKLSATIFLCKLWGSLHMNYKLALVF